MQCRSLGKEGLKVSAVGLGCMGMSEFYGDSATRDDTESVRVIHMALDQGVTFLDTADMYGPYLNEELVGKALATAKGGRSRVVIATKFGILRSPTDPKIRGVSGKPDYVKQACEGSLKRLGVDAIDLYYQHRVDPQTPIEETVSAMAELVKEGKIKHIGLSEAGVADLRKANAIHPITALQTEYSLWTRDPEDAILPTCRELGIGFVAYSPLGRGFLTGQIQRFDDLPADDYRRQSPRFQGDNFQKNLDLVEKIKEMATKKRCTPAQLAIAWVLHQGNDVVPIPGTKRQMYLGDNLGGVAVTLTPADLKELDAIAPKGIASGPRYPEAAMQLLGR